MKNGIKSVITLSLICFSVALVLAVTYHFTAPIIERNKANAATDSLSAVLPDGKDFEKISLAANTPKTVKEIYKETNGIGYAVTVEVSSSYSSSPMMYTVGIGMDGKIKGIVITSYSESKDFGKDTYPKTYIGMDSALNGAELVAGVTYSSSAFKDGVEDVFTALIEMKLISAGEKTEDQKQKETINKILAGALNDSGTAIIEEYESGKFEKIYKAVNGSGYALITADKKVITVNPFGHVKGYDIDGNIISLSDTEKNDAAGAVPNNSKNGEEKDQRVLARYAAENAVFNRLESTTLLSTVTNLFEINEDGTISYGFVSNPIGYNNGVMTVYGILSADGGIKKIKVSQIILYSEYYDGYTLDEDEYYQGFEGKTESTLTDGDTLISGATISANAINKAIKDMFAVYGELKKDGN